MKNRIILSMLLLFALFLAGSGVTMLYLYKTTSNLESVIKLHRVELIRQDLVISAQTVLTHLYTFGTAFGPEMDIIVDNVLQLEDSANRCLSCHHNKETTAKLTEVVNIVQQYEDSLSYLITTSANEKRVELLKLVAIGIGSNLLQKSQEMATIAGEKLKDHTVQSIKEINNSRVILIITIILSFFIAIAIAVTMTRQVTEPIYELVNATRKIKSGNLGYTTHYQGSDEFGELIASFNDMSQSLKTSNDRVLRHISALSNLYTVTLSLHSIADRHDIVRELSYGVAELVGAEQAGVILLEGDIYVHQHPALGLDKTASDLFCIPRTELIKYYAPSSRRAVIANGNLDASPFAAIERALGVKNVIYVWVRQKADLIGAIRIANKRSGDFTDEDAQTLAILSNNVAVALENSALYENLRGQMTELRLTQDQLVQATKLAAIGELASNIAHEINNPLTSILGYAELIKEESDPENILKDVEVIEKESLRAKEIVHQLLEFSRKRALKLENTDINRTIREVIELVSMQVKDTMIDIVQNYSEVPHIEVDSNQLKQVFLNIINNAIYAMNGAGRLTITTLTQGNDVLVKIEDTGTGIPKEHVQRIFEPFFSTKNEKGTGIGLSVSYKIIQSHGGQILVESEPGAGTAFTLVLPLKRTVKAPGLNA